MATKTKKKAHAKRHVFRNAAAAAPLPRAVASSRREVHAEADDKKKHRETPGWLALKSAAGAAGAALACAYIAREDWLPPRVITGLVTAFGAGFAVGGNSDTMRSVGSGAMAAAGAQLGLMTIDDHYRERSGTVVASAPTPPGKKPANAEALSARALEAAYERARQRLALSSTGDPRVA